MLDVCDLEKWISEYENDRLKSEQRPVKRIVEDKAGPIVGGNKTPIVPEFNLALMHADIGKSNYVHWTSGVLVQFEFTERNYVITAGHAINEKEKTYQIYCGSNRLADFQSNPKYNVSVVKNFYSNESPDSIDLAILTFENRVASLKELAISPLELNQHSELLQLENGMYGVVFGWGICHNRGWSKSLDLNHAVMEPEEIDKASGKFICTSFDERGPCRKDSGAPLVAIWGTEIRLAGIVLGNGSDEWCHSHRYPTQFLSLKTADSEIRREIEAFEKT